MRRRSMHKIAALVLSGAMMLGMAGCGKKDDSSEATTSASSEAKSEAKTEAKSEAKTEAKTEAATEAATEAKKDLNIKDGQVLVDCTFDKDVDGFVTYTNGGAFDMESKDGKLVAHIGAIGSVMHGVQAFYDGFQLLQGGVYTFSFDVSSSVERSIEYRLQINGGDYHAYQGEVIQVGPEEKTIEVDFTMNEDSDPAPRIVFNMGRMPDTENPDGKHDVMFDNVKLTVKDSSNAQVLEGLPDYPNVNVSQIGYLPDDKKIVVVKSQDTDKFEVLDSSGNSVYSGTFGDIEYHSTSSSVVRVGDFSEVKTPGEYKIKTDVGETFPFQIGEGIYSDLYGSVVRMLYLQRCGIEIPEADAGKFAHPACHSTEAVVYGTSEKREVNGGWHDAGDYGRYVVAGAKTVQDLMLAYEDYGIDADDMNIPESGNGKPDLLDEAKYELDWMLKMQEPSNGGVYHKVSCYAFPEEVAPQDETEELVLAPISAAATADFAAVMAKASVVYKSYDADFAKKCYDAAVKAWDYVKSIGDKLPGFENPDDIATGEYKDPNVRDEAFWAAAELYLAGYTDIKDEIAARWEQTTNSLDLGWADISGYAMYDLLRGAPEGIDTVMDEVKARFYDKIAALEAKADSYGIMLNGAFPWGSNMTIANYGMLMNMAYNLTGDTHYSDLAKRQRDYLLGANPLGYCFVTNFGSVSPKQPHHRPSQVAGEAMPGMLIGGADSNLEDSYAKAVLFDQPPAMCYADNVQSYSTNEITIYWNSPLIYLLSAYQK